MACFSSLVCSRDCFFTDPYLVEPMGREDVEKALDSRRVYHIVSLDF